MIEAPNTFTTARLTLRRPTLSDASAIFDYASDPQVVRYMDYGVCQNISELEERLKSKPDQWDAGHFSWVITIQPDDRPVGTIGCSCEGHAVDFGYLLNRHFWGQGYATEAARKIVEWAIDLPEIYRVWATCDIQNTASKRVLEKCSLTLEGTLRSYCVRPNISPIPRDAFMYARISR